MLLSALQANILDISNGAAAFENYFHVKCFQFNSTKKPGKPRITAFKKHKFT